MANRLLQGEFEKLRFGHSIQWCYSWGSSDADAEGSVKLLIATNNPGKVREYQELLEDLPINIEITYPAQEGLALEVEESGETFEENARLKAMAFAQASGLWTLADDSGLEVDALDGAPGVRSARYAGPGANDADRYWKLLDALAGVPAGQRSARFRCVVALAQADGDIHTADGTCEGEIGLEPKGAHGFGYDPVFVVEGYGGHTMAELPPEIKNRISHRGRALAAIRPMLEQLVAG
jgi:XTP/dITP diphosphohydrolase